MGATDNEIIERIRAGDSRKYALLVNRHKDKAFTLAVRLVGDRREAEEVVQDGFMRAYRNLEQFRGDAKFSTWFYRIVYNLCMTKVSRRRWQPEIVDVHRGEMSDNVFVDKDEIGFDERLENEELNQIVVDEVNLLPEKYRTPITLFYLQEMSYEEMTEVMNLPLGTVKTNLFRGRNLLRERVLVRLKGEIV
ncbi:MAG: sigma-70 family RNA polymerase sigma factor [Bacteroidota bacterium]